MSCPEAMLGWRERKGVEFGEKEALEDLGCRTKDRDWAVAGALVSGFGGFEEGDNGGRWLSSKWRGCLLYCTIG